MQTIPLILLTPLPGLPAGSKGRGFIGKTRAVFVPESGRPMYVFDNLELVGPDPMATPEPQPTREAPAPAPSAPSRWRPMGEVLSLVGLFPLLSGCEPVTELRAAFGYGAVFGAFVAVVAAVVVVRFRELEERRMDVGRALGSPGPQIRDAIERGRR